MINLFQHQQQALDETEGKNRVAYYLDMGLGKTFVGSEKALKLNSRVNLLVCQCSKVQDWIEHMTENYAMNHCWMIYDMTKKNEFDWFMKAAMEVDNKRAEDCLQLERLAHQRNRPSIALPL